jgi:hypothetical protein
MNVYTLATSLIFGLAPLFGWSSISYELTGASCTVDMMKPDLAYILYIIVTFVWFFLLPVLAMIYVKYSLDPKEKNKNNVIQKIQ